MTAIVDWAARRARMVMAFIVLSLAVGGFAYWQLPKEGEPDIEIPALFVSVPFPGISAADSESLLVKPMETELQDLDGLKTMGATAAEGYAGVSLEFEFGWDKTKTMADVRDAMSRAEADFPSGAQQYSINEINFSEFPIVVVNLTGAVPERTMTRLAKDLQDRIEGLDAVLDAGLAGNRDEMLEVLIDPLRLESYNVTAAELIGVVQNNNQLIAAGEIESDTGTFAIKIPSSFASPRDVYDLPVTVNGNRVVTLGDLATINLAFEDRTGTSRFNGETSLALQVVKRKGYNLIDTVAEVERIVEETRASWPPELRAVVAVGTSNDQSRQVASMVSQLEGSVLTAVALVMIVVLAALGLRPALLVGFAIPTSFLLCFAFLALMGVSVSNIVMFGLILAVGMLVDGAIVVVEYADKRIAEGTGPMHAYVEAAKRMFWPVVSSTATTLCAFLPMLFWPGIPGQFMGMLPVTLIFVLSASLVVALVYLPVMGGVVGRLERWLKGRVADIAGLPRLAHLALLPLAALAIAAGAAAAPVAAGAVAARFGGLDGGDMLGSAIPGLFLAFALILCAALAAAVALVGGLVLILALAALFVRAGAAAGRLRRRIFGGAGPDRLSAGYRRTPFGRLIALIATNPVGPVAAVGLVFVFVCATFLYYGQNQNGVEFFVESEPEFALVYIKARGNLSLTEKDALVARAEKIVLAHPGVKSAFAFAGASGLDNNTGGAEAPKDTIGQVQFETIPWEDRIGDASLDGDVVIAELAEDLATIPGIKTEILNLAQGPTSAKPLHLRITGENWGDLLAVTEQARGKFDATPGLRLVEDTRPLPGIDWQIDVDVERAGRYGADVALVGAMVQLVTRGILLDTMRVDSSDEEIDIRVRLPEAERLLSTFDTLRIRTSDGLVPLSNFVTRTPVRKLAEINRTDQKRYFDVKADVLPDLVKAVDSDGAIAATLQRVPDASAATIDSPDGPLKILQLGEGAQSGEVASGLETGALDLVPVTANERIALLTEWLDAQDLPVGIGWEWTGDQEDQAESQAFLGQAFGAALFLMFIILLAQFNSFYNATLVLLAVVLSTTGVLIGMLVMGQTFSIIMTGTGIVALAGIVVNNNIVLIDTYQEYELYMPRDEAIVRTAEDRIRPVLLTTITTMAGLAPMAFGLSLDFFGGGYTIDSPTALWWKQLATAVVYGLGVATVLTLIFTPAMLAARVWVSTYALWLARALAALSLGRASRAAQDWAVSRRARRIHAPLILWDEGDTSGDPASASTRLRAAE